MSGRRCIGALEVVFSEIEKHHKADDFMYDMYRAASVKEFELVQEQSDKLLRERPAIKDLFRRAARRGLIQVDAAERWLGYCGNRNDTADASIVGHGIVRVELAR